MDLPRHHFFVCVHKRGTGDRESCGSRPTSEAEAVFSELAAAVDKHGLWYDVLVSSSGCLGPCASGPTVVVYPEGTWYGPVTCSDVEDIVREHMIGGKPVERLVRNWAAPICRRDSHGRAGSRD